MYTSVTDNNTERTNAANEGRRTTLADQRSAAAGRIAFNYLAASVICAAIGLIYELFSHGVWSTYMVLGWVFPLVLGALPNFLIWLTKAKEPGTAAENVYACGIATFTVGCMLKGVLEIFGTTSHLLKVYPIAGTALTAIGAIIYLLGKKKAEV
ncbi:MAG: hypothetical protein K6A91_05010 [Clostridia bacterium]|nr:hypothetical protein [Clostridia bacterium]